MRRLFIALSFCASCHSATKEADTASVTDKTALADPPPANEHHDGPALAYAGDADPATAQLLVGDGDDFALIIVDGITRGTTPRTADNPIAITPGAHHVEVRQLPSGPSKSFDITVAAHEVYKLGDRK